MFILIFSALLILLLFYLLGNEGGKSKPHAQPARLDMRLLSYHTGQRYERSHQYQMDGSCSVGIYHINGQNYVDGASSTVEGQNADLEVIYTFRRKSQQFPVSYMSV